MKTIFIIMIAIGTGICSASAGNYTISSNKTWSSAIGGSCWTCTITISSGVTLTIDANVTCGTCTISGGNILINNNFTCQSCTLTSENITMNNQTLTLQSSTTTFTNVLFSASGTGGLNATGPMTLVNSTFNFGGTTSISNSGGQLSMSNSTINLAGSASLTATAGPVNLASNSHIIVGDGTASSTSFLNMNGPTLNLVDAGSSVMLANKNNYYFNWSSYNSLSNSKSYSTTSNSLNCGGAGQNACNVPTLYGPASLSASGMSGSVVLGTVLGDFTAGATGADAVLLKWSVSNPEGLDHFAVQRSQDAKSWETIHTVDASNVSGAYHVADDATPSGIAYYRIQLVNLDGTISNSKIISVNTALANTVSIFPNPVTSAAFYVKFSAETSAVIHVFSVSGQLLYTSAVSGQIQYRVIMPSISVSGVLVVQVITKEKTSSFSVLNKS